jgi:hypothetical protein
MESTQTLMGKKRGRMEIGDSNLPPILMSGCQDHFHGPGNPHGKTVGWGVEEPLTGKTPASFQQLRLNLRPLHDSPLN